MNRKILLAIVLLLLTTISNADLDCNLKRKYIGVASIDSKGIISLFLWAADDTHEGFSFLIDKNDPRYEKILKNVNKRLKVGEYSYVKPTFDNPDGKVRSDVKCYPVPPPPPNAK